MGSCYSLGAAKMPASLLLCTRNRVGNCLSRRRVWRRRRIPSNLCGSFASGWLHNLIFLKVLKWAWSAVIFLFSLRSNSADVCRAALRDCKKVIMVSNITFSSCTATLASRLWTMLGRKLVTTTSSLQIVSWKQNRIRMGSGYGWQNNGRVPTNGLSGKL